MAEEQKPAEDWMQKKWRPAMGWTYMIICLLDMAIFPVLWALLLASLKQPITAWQPLTLQGAGLFHIAMGAVLGIAAFGRTQEKVAGAANNTVTPSSPAIPRTYAPYINNISPSFQPQQMAADYSTRVVQGYGGKPAPIQPPHPEI